MLDFPFRFRRHEDADWLLRVQTTGAIKPIWVEEPLAIYHCEATKNRISTHVEWKSRYQWYLENPTLITPKALPYYIGMLCIPEAQNSPSPLRACSFLWKEAVKRGHLSLKAIAYLAMTTFSSRTWRSKLREKWPRLQRRTSLQNAPNPDKFGGSFQGIKTGKANPVVTVIIPYYSQERYIRETVLSAVNQQGAQMEVIVIDDGSPEPVAPHLEGIGNVKIIRVNNQGCAASRNYGFQQSTGDYILFLDHDDVLQPGAVAAHLAALAKEPEAALSFGAYRVVDANGRELEPPYVCKRRKDFHLMMFQNNPMPSPGTALIRRKALEEVGGFNSLFSTQVDDYDLYLRLIQKHPLTRHDFCVLNYRQHSSNVSNDRQKMLKGTLEVLDRIGASGQLTPAEMRRLKYGRARWIHHFNPSTSLRYRLQELYYRFRTMLTLPPSVWFE